MIATPRATPASPVASCIQHPNASESRSRRLVRPVPRANSRGTPSAPAVRRGETRFVRDRAQPRTTSSQQDPSRRSRTRRSSTAEFATVRTRAQATRAYRSQRPAAVEGGAARARYSPRSATTDFAPIDEVLPAGLLCPELPAEVAALEDFTAWLADKE